MSVNSVTRIRVITLSICVIAIICLARLFFLQVVQGGDYADMADRQYLRPSTNMFDRGSIYFADKDNNLISAATLKVGYFIGINPTKIKDANAEADTLAGIIPEFNKEDFISRA